MVTRSVDVRSEDVRLGVDEISAVEAVECCSVVGCVPDGVFGAVVEAVYQKKKTRV